MAATIWLDGDCGEFVSAEAQPGPGAGVRLELCWREGGFLRILLLEMDRVTAAELAGQVSSELARAMKEGEPWREQSEGS